jgi:O-antigen/teichoic acid export membrane protein
MIIGTICYEGYVSFIRIFFIVLYSGFTLIREYLIVSFRLNLNYKAILLNNLILAFGYFVGLIFFDVAGYWQIIYVFGSGLSLLYTIKKSNLINERFQITTLFRTTLYKSFILFISSMVNSIMNYADKLILFPLLGPRSVAVYYSATIMGKIIAMAITPISGVLLSYLAKIDKVSFKKFISILSSIIIIGVGGYFVIIVISDTVLKLLYPNWASESLELIYITTATAIVGVVSSVIHPIILRYNHINWQIIINSINLLVYIFAILIFYKYYGLIGFCMGVLVSSIIKLLIMIFAFVYSNYSI